MSGVHKSAKEEAAGTIFENSNRVEIHQDCASALFGGSMLHDGDSRNAELSPPGIGGTVRRYFGGLLGPPDGTPDYREALVNAADITRAMTLLYGHGALEGDILLQVVADQKTDEGLFGLAEIGRNRKIRARKFCASLPDAICAAQDLARKAAREERGGPRVAHVAMHGVTFNEVMKRHKDSGKEYRFAGKEAVVQYRAGLADHDDKPGESRQKLRNAGLSPTFSTETGSIGVDGAPKGHDWFVFKEPLTDKSQIERAERVFNRIATYAGTGDNSVSSSVHPVRIPGSPNRKKQPATASRIVNASGPRWTLEDLEARINAVAPELKSKHRAKTHREKMDGRTQYRTNVREGVNMHNNLCSLAMSLAWDGRWTPQEVELELESLMLESIRAEVGDATWSECFQDIARIVNDAFQKLESEEDYINRIERLERMAEDRDPEAKRRRREEVLARIRLIDREQYKNVGPPHLDPLIDDAASLLLDADDCRFFGQCFADAISDKGMTAKLAKKLKARVEQFRREFEKHSDVGDDDTRPVIDLSEIDADVAAKTAWEALRADSEAKINNGEEPKVFIGPEGLTRINDDGETPVLQPLTVPSLQVELQGVTRWTQNGSAPYKVPDYPICSGMLSTPDTRVPPIKGFIDVPSYSPAGTLIMTMGYHSEVQKIYRPRVAVPPVSEVPSEEEVTQARALLLGDVFEGFPFLDDEPQDVRNEVDARVRSGELTPAQGRDVLGNGSRADAISLALLPFVKDYIGGNTPLHLIRKNNQRVGSGLLLDAVSTIAYGSPAPMSTLATDEAEIRKGITTKVKEAAPFYIIDNFEGELRSLALASAMTGGIWEDRELGGNTLIRGKPDFIYAATTNNGQLGADFPDRTCLIRLNSRHPRPNQRTDVKHRDLLNHIRGHRGELVWACLTLIQNWFAHGATPGNGVVMGGFQRWADVMGGILRDAGINGFMTNRDLLRSGDVDVDLAARTEFLTVWWNTFGDKDQRCGDPDKGHLEGGGLLRMIRDAEVGIPALDADRNPSAASQRRRLSGFLSEITDVPVVIQPAAGGERTTVAVTSRYDDHSKARLYRLVKL